MDLIKIAKKLAKVPILGDILAWYGRRAIRDRIFSVDDFVNTAIAGQIEELEKTPDEDLKRLLNLMQNQDSKTFRAAYEESAKYWPSYDALEQFVNRMITEIENILFLREHRQRHQ